MGISQPKIQRQINAKNQRVTKKGWPILREVNEKERKIKMRTICDVCERGAAILFCAADEAALCRACDHKVHNVNKLASRHVRVGLADPSDVPRCDICENAPAFFYCEVDGTSLCLQCDMVVHVGGKRTHGRFLLLRQRVKFPGDEPGQVNNLAAQVVTNTCGNGKEQSVQQPHPQPTKEGKQHIGGGIDPDPRVDSNRHTQMNSEMIDLNMNPQPRHHGQASNNHQ